MGVRLGIVISPIMPIPSRPTGIASSHAQRPSDASGRDRCRLTAMADTASAMVTTNFRSKNGFLIAVMTSLRIPSSIMNMTTDTGAAKTSPIRSD